MQTLGRTSIAILLLALAGCGDRSADGDRFVLDAGGRQVDPLTLLGPRGAVFLFTRTDCPISNRYAPLVGRLDTEYSGEGIRFWLVYPDANEGAPAIRHHREQYAYPCGFLRDTEHHLVNMTGARITPEAAVYVPGADRPRLVYCGRIDDQYVAFGQERPAPTRSDLREVLDAVATGQPPEFRRTEAVGCTIPAALPGDSS